MEAAYERTWRCPCANTVRELGEVFKDTELLPILLSLEGLLVALHRYDLRIESPLETGVHVADLTQRPWTKKPRLRGEFFAFHLEILAP